MAAARSKSTGLSFCQTIYIHKSSARPSVYPSVKLSIYAKKELGNNKQRVTDKDGHKHMQFTRHYTIYIEQYNRDTLQEIIYKKGQWIMDNLHRSYSWLIHKLPCYRRVARVVDCLCPSLRMGAQLSKSLQWYFSCRLWRKHVTNSHVLRDRCAPSNHIIINTTNIINESIMSGRLSPLQEWNWVAKSR